MRERRVWRYGRDKMSVNWDEETQSWQYIVIHYVKDDLGHAYCDDGFLTWQAAKSNGLQCLWNLREEDRADG